MAHNSTSGRVPPLRQGASDYYEALAREAINRMLHIPDPPSNWVGLLLLFFAFFLNFKFTKLLLIFLLNLFN
jgi:hypothetical protein